MREGEVQCSLKAAGTAVVAQLLGTDAVPTEEGLLQEVADAKPTDDEKDAEGKGDDEKEEAVVVGGGAAREKDVDRKVEELEVGKSSGEV
jgi:hypothetical protein